MSACVLDASFACQWLFGDEASPAGDAALRVIAQKGALVPALWVFEITNVLGLAARRGRLSVADVQEALGLLRSLPLIVDEPLSLGVSDSLLSLMQTHRLTAYDATYLELAQRHGLALATKDRELLAAASSAGVPLFQVVIP